MGNQVEKLNFNERNKVNSANKLILFLNKKFSDILFFLNILICFIYLNKRKGKIINVKELLKCNFSRYEIK